MDPNCFKHFNMQDHPTSVAVGTTNGNGTDCTRSDTNTNQFGPNSMNTTIVNPGGQQGSEHGYARPPANSPPLQV